MGQKAEPKRVKLTKAEVNKLTMPKPENGKAVQQFVWDKELHGFGARLTPTGITYIVQGRVNGKTRRVTIGKHGVFTPDEARKKAMATLQDMANGKDPAAEKARKKVSQITLQEIAEDYKKDRSLKNSSAADIDKHLAGVFSDWKDQPIVKITRQSVLDRFRKRSKESKAQTNQAFRILRALLNYARATHQVDDKPIMPENPCQILSDAKMWHNLQPRNRRIPTDKVGKAWNLLQQMREDPSRTIIGQNTAAAVAFTLLTGARWGEVSTLTWEQINFEDQTWHIPDPKNKQPVTMPLSRQALEILQAQPTSGEYMFKGRGKTGYIGKPIRVMRSISEVVGETLSVHDLRRTFRAIAGECGLELWKTKLLMNHKLNDDVTINSYTETSNLSYLQPQAQQIADWIERQAQIAANDKVVDLGQARQKVSGGL